MEINEKKFLEDKSRYTRYLLMDELGTLGVGHVGGCLSVVECLVVLYHKVMNINPEDPKMEGRDRLVLSKGHAGPALYAVLADKGFFPKEWLHTLNKPETRLPSHCDMIRTPGIDMTAGSLGQGISCAVGIAKASKIKKDHAYVYAIVGDGESQEGEVWEAAMSAAHFKLNNLIAFTDKNKLQIDGTVEEIMGIECLESKWKAFGWNVYSVDGHKVEEIFNAIEMAKLQKDAPSMIILNTIKGKGVSFVEAAGAKNHNMPITKEQTIQALKELE
jgi:transketolase